MRRYAKASSAASFDSTRITLAATFALAIAALLLFGTSTAHAVFGSAGEFGAGQLSDPQRVAVNQAADQVLVVDRGNDRVLVYADSGAAQAPDSMTLVGEFGAGLLSDPVGIAVNQDLGYIYVTDAGNARVVRFDVADLSTFDPADITAVDDQFGSVDPDANCGTGGAFETLAVGVAVDPTTDDVLVPDRAGCVQRFDADGAFLSSFDGSDGGTRFDQTSDPANDTLGPRDVAVDSTGSIYVAEAHSGESFTAEGGRVQRFTPAGVGERTLPMAHPQGVVSVDPSTADVFAADAPRTGIFGTQQALVRQFDAAGVQVDSFGLANFPAPRRSGIAVNPSLERAYVVDNTTGRVLVFEPAEPPVVETDSASPVEWTTATLNGTVNARGVETTWQFEYGTEPGGPYSLVAPPDPQSGGSGSTAEPRSVDLTGLQPATTYYYRLSASSFGGSTQGDEESFTTLAEVPPAAEIDPVSDITAHTATFSGSVNPQGPVTPPSPDTRYHFEYKRSVDSTWTVVPIADDNLGHGTDSVDVVQEVDELPANTDLDVRLVAVKDGGAGSDIAATQFTTAARTPQVTATGAGADARSATLRAQLRAHNALTDYHFEYGTTTAYGETVDGTPVGPAGSPATLGNAVSVTEPITGLQPETTYHFRVIAENEGGAVASPDRTFTTSPALEASIEPSPPISAFAPGEIGYELVSRADTGSYEVGRVGGIVPPSFGHSASEGLVSSADGNHVAYEIGPQATFPGLGPDGDIADYAIASRDQQGWNTAVPAGNRSGVGCSPSGGQPGFLGISDEGTKLLYAQGCPNDNLTLSDGLDAGTFGNVFMLDATTDASPPMLTRFGVQAPLPNRDTYNFDYLGGSPDLSTVYFASNADAVPGLSAPPDHFSPRYIFKRVDLGLPELVTRTATGDPFAVSVTAGPYTLDAVTPITTDGSAIALTAPSDSPMVARDSNAVFDTYQVRGDHVTWISDPAAVPSWNRPPPQPPENRELEGASGDGKRIYFSTNERLTNDDADAVRDIYVYDFDREPASRISRVSTKDPACDTCADDLGNGGGQDDSQAKFSTISPDGARSFFVTGDVLSSEDGDSQQSLYVHELGGLTTYVAPAGIAATSASDGTDAGLEINGSLVRRENYSGRQITVSPTGEVAVFSLATDVSLPESRGGVDADETRDRFIWRADGGQTWQQRLRRIPQGLEPSSNTTADPGIDCYSTFEAPTPKTGCRGVSSDGSLVFFPSQEGLVARDSNEFQDVYVIDTRTGAIELVAPPFDFRIRGGASAAYSDNSASGDSVFFLTRATLDPSRDRDGGAPDMYVARTGDVLPPLPPPPACEGDACQPPAAPQPGGFTTPGSGSFSGQGDEQPKRVKPKKCKKNQVRRKGRCVRKKPGKQKVRADVRGTK